MDTALLKEVYREECMRNGTLPEYLRLVRSGNTPQFAAMLANRKFPGSRTSGDLTKGCGTLADQFKGNESQLDYITRVSMENGYKPSNNDVWCPGLAEFTGDPAGFVPSTDDRSHIKRVCEERGTGCHGRVEIEPRVDEPAPDVKLADDLVQESVKDMVKADPSLKTKPVQELKEMAIEAHGAKP